MSLASLFRYPDSPLVVPRGKPELDAFANEMAALDVTAQQATYTSTFDLAPSCPPYLGVHLFGDENPDRARLMVGLRLAYRRAGIESHTAELPDHIAEVLEFADRAEGEERDDLLRLVVQPALRKMQQILAPTANPYRHLVAAALHECSAGGVS